jgi:hypothetical protein
MNMYSLLQAGLFLHMIGLTTVAGVTLANYITSRQFRMQYAIDKQKGLAIMQAISKLPMVAGIGLLLQIVSGMLMMAATGGGFGEQLWFKIKMIFVILVIGSVIFLNRGLQRRLHNWVASDMVDGNRSQQIKNLAGRIGYLQLFLLSLFLIIFLLSVYKFV